MSDDIFKQRPAINPNEFDGAGEADESDVSSMRSHLQGGVQMTGVPPQGQVPPGGVQMTGAIPPQVQAAMQQSQFVNHPLNPQQAPQQQFFQQPAQKDEFQLPQAMTDAQAMYQNARKLMKQPQQEQQQQPQQFNPEFNPQQVVQQNKYNDFKDPRFELVMDKLTKKSGNYEQIELPSRGRFYLRGEGPSNGILHIRPMTGAEEQILTTPRYVKKNQTLNMIFRECIGEQINPDLLLSEDRTYLLIYLRGISYSPLYDVEIKCPECTKVFQNKIHLNDLDVDYCPDDFGPEDLQDVLPNSGLNIRFRLSTGRDETTVQEHRDQRINQWGSDVADDTTLFRSSLLIEEVEGITNKLMVQQIVSRLPIGDMAYLRELLNEPPFGVDTRVGVICPHCSHEFRIDMPMELSFFFPKPILQKRKKQRV
jgi:Sec-independent protein translocase protein TatA